jgi:sirohydrochlorin cobaltochelatase
MLFAAGHVKNDLPWEVNSFAAANPGIHVQFGRELAVDAKLLRAASECIAEAEARSDRRVDRSRTLLLVVGRGTNDSDANSNVSKVARMLWEGMGFGWCEVSYSGVAHPLVDVGLRHALRLGYERIIVFPYFLFTGILVQRIYDRADEAAAGNAHVEVLKAPYLNDHPLVVATLVDRLDETLRGSGVMNCQLCKYREQIIGYDQEVGAPQAGHHHHVRGIGTDAGHHHGHVHHSHAHGHQRSRSGHHEHPHDRRTSGGAALQDEHS